MAVQLIVVEYWPGQKKYVKSGTLCFVVESLKPLTSVPYILTFGPKNVAPAIATDLHVKTTTDMVEITTSRVGNPTAARGKRHLLHTGLTAGGARPNGGHAFGHGRLGTWQRADGRPEVGNGMQRLN